MFPLRENNEGIQPPVQPFEEDPCDLGEEYPGYSKYAHCGKHPAAGEKWNRVLYEEINYFQKKKSGNI